MVYSPPNCPFGTPNQCTQSYSYGLETSSISAYSTNPNLGDAVGTASSTSGVMARLQGKIHSPCQVQI